MENTGFGLAALIPLFGFYALIDGSAAIFLGLPKRYGLVLAGVLSVLGGAHLKGFFFTHNRSRTMNLKTSLPLWVSLSFLPLSLSAATQETQGKPGQAAGKAPAGYVIVEEEVTYSLPDNFPDQNMKSAQRNLDKKDLKASARDVRKAEDYLKGEESRSGPKSDSALLASMAELEKIAMDLDQGASVMDKDLAQAFARAHLALAASDREKAAEHLASKEPEKAGEEMKAGANHVEKASEWSGNKLEKTSKNVLKKTQELSGKLLQGVGWVPEEIGKGITALGTEIDRLGQKLEKSKPEATGSASR